MDNNDLHDDGKKQSTTSITLPLRTTFTWRPSSSSSSVYPPSDLNIWTSKLPNNLSLNRKQNLINPIQTLLKLTPPPNVLIVLIPGNPGLINFYNIFLEQLFKNLSSKNISSQIFCLGHMGHSLNNSNFTDLSYLQNFLLFSKSLKMPPHPNLKEQVQFHQDFLGHLLKNLINPKQTKIILIGHSVGAYIATKVLEKYSNDDEIFHIFGLFPTLSNIGMSQNGQSLLMSILFSPITLPFLHIFQFLIFSCLLIPKNLIIIIIIILKKLKIFNLLLSRIIKSVTPHYYQSNLSTSYQNLIIMCNLVQNLNSVSAALIMARSEMKEILDVDQEFFKTHKDKISLYYTKKSGDAWINEVEFDKISKLLESPLSTVNDSKSVSEPISNDPARGVILQEGINTGKRYERSIEGVPHAFCLEHSEIVAQKCATWIQNILIS